MAACSSQGSSLAPNDFNVSTSFDDPIGVISVAIERCPLCRRSRNHLYCSNCLQKGDFIHSKSTKEDQLRYGDKEQRWCLSKERLKELEERCEQPSKTIKAVSVKNAEMFFCKQRIDLLKKALKVAQEKVGKAKNDLHTFKKNNAMLRTRYKKLKDKRQRLEEYTAQKESSVPISRDTLLRMEEELAALRKEHVDNLFEYIFSVDEIQPKSDQDSMKVSTVSALAEARQTAYIRGRWVYLDNGGELQYRIIEPCLPGNGDYTAFCLWVSANRESVSNSDVNQQNPAYTYTAALSYTTQLISILAHLLDISLPKRICYSEFYNSNLDEKQFKKLVFRLNHNIIYLCCSQRVPTNSLNVRHTLHNLMTLPRTPFLGRSAPFILNQELVMSMEEHSQWDESSDEDDDDVFDWENVSTTLPDIHSDSTQSASSGGTRTSVPSASSSLAASPPGGGLMTSIASFWRAATGTDKK